MADRTYRGFISVLGSLVVIAYMYTYAVYVPWDILATPARQMVILALLFHVLNYAWTILWWTTYTPVATAAGGDITMLPHISVVMPVYNESSFVCYALQSVLRSSYPKDRLEVIVVDDGSLDDSWECIAATAIHYIKKGVRYRTYRHKQNQGKRFAIKTGFAAATGEIIVSLDSDSVLDRDTLMALVTPFVYHRNLGGVAGHLSVLNVERKFIPRLLNVLFDTYGNIPRAAQSRACGAVTILPGALSAFRATAVRPLLQPLCETIFWGKPMKHGEDIELTLGLLRSGWNTSYQSNAVVRTTAPETVRAALLTYTRWERSSLIYLFSGLIQLAGKGIVRPSSNRVTCSIEHQCANRSVVDQNDETYREVKQVWKNGTTRLGTLFLFLNLVSTATNNLVLPFVLYAQLRNTILQPWKFPINMVAVALLSGFQNLVLDNFGINQEHAKQQGGGHALSSHDWASTRVRSLGDALLNAKADEKPYLVDYKAQLLPRLKYTALALVFHAGVIAWSSVIAIVTLRSQKWLTR